MDKAWSFRDSVEDLFGRMEIPVEEAEEPEGEWAFDYGSEEAWDDIARENGQKNKEYRPKTMSHRRDSASQDEKTASQGPARARECPSRRGIPGVPRAAAGVPEMVEAGPFWWAKAARNVSWRGDRAARILICGGAVAVTAFVTAVFGGRYAGAMAAATVMAFIILDPITILCRRVAIQTRVLISIALSALVFSSIWPSPQAWIATVIIAFVAVALSILGNEQWVVETNYCSSSELYKAFARNPNESSRQALNTKEPAIFAFLTELGLSPQDHLTWAAACGCFCMGWLAGRKNGAVSVADKEHAAVAAEVEELQEEIEELDARCEEAEAEKEQLEEDKAELEEEIKRLKAWQEESRKENEDLIEQVTELQREAMERPSESTIRVWQEKETADKIKGLEDQIAALKEEAEEFDQKLLVEKDDGYREKLMWYEWQLGSRSAREISRNTGVPRSTVQRWINKKKEAEEAAQNVEEAAG